ncbi:MAG: V/A-type H+-transporting ATPase subunit E [Lysobacterales bacterium]|jgi:V/A-type H+-transporting ATPase subunit E
MSQQVQDLIDKIKRDGTLAAEQKAVEIERDAQTKANAIVQEAKKEAVKLIKEANDTAQKAKQSGQMALKQASRDVLLSLRKEIDALLNRILVDEIKDSLSTESLTSIIAAAVGSGGDGDVVVTLSDADAKTLKEGLTAKLQNKVKGSFKVQSASDVSGGFAISYDGGKSGFEFTDVALAGYLGGYVNEQLATLLSGEAS